MSSRGVLAGAVGVGEEGAVDGFGELSFEESEGFVAAVAGVVSALVVVASGAGADGLGVGGARARSRWAGGGGAVVDAVRSAENPLELALRFWVDQHGADASEAQAAVIAEALASADSEVGG